MKKTWTTPSLQEHGAVEALTQQTKTLGLGDGVILVIDGLTPPEGVPIDSL
ncbi:hypothetical protein IQ260_03490 [Leptolyngbya cf. ectocarpi LEGE 11479]|uniref:Uncharacterized protein n=1 Tax=Leptolyngbya cf. ectocarpi LEGE 11479 TaxID=1828722 RepID=A0A928ZSS6_LEPEC|nr:hypothetical protein [Leptolyngbya ectocarpi]MBE9065711.1 hypothetical protein [Leptolyngbya cf. ectocarpi LEGE 11479]